MPTVNEKRWFATRLVELDRGDIESFLAAFYALPESKTDEVHEALAYFENNQERMRYGRFRELGLFIGSGTVEAGCKTLVHQRLKLSGMRWSLRGAGAIVSLRAHSASGRWDEIWRRLHLQTGAA